MEDKIERKRLTILKLLSETQEPVSSLILEEQMKNWGYEVSERTIRLYLKALDEEGLTKPVIKKGRLITKKGLSELSKARVSEKVGFLSARINQMIYQMNFNLNTKKGSIVLNISFIEKKDLERSVELMYRVFHAKYSMGSLLTLFHEGEYVYNTFIPEGYLGIGTVCSITVNGVLLSHGIPVNSRFGGLLELNEGKPVRFTEIINYDGTTIDPLEIFIKAGLTDYTGATKNGNGLIGASFREIPMESREKVIEIAKSLEKIGLASFMEIGWPEQNLLQIPVNEGAIGAIIIGGLNPVAILEEQGIKVYSKALSSLIEYEKLFSYQELLSRYKSFM